MCCEKMAHYSSRWTYYEGGAKNPLKSTSVKLLVFAWDAQSWVDAGRKRATRLRTQGDFQWHGYPDPVSVETCYCAWTYSRCGNSDSCTKQIWTCNAVHRAFRRVTLCADVACLAWGGWMRDQRGSTLARVRIAIARWNPTCKRG